MSSEYGHSHLNQTLCHPNDVIVSEINKNSKEQDGTNVVDVLSNPSHSVESSNLCQELMFLNNNSKRSWGSSKWLNRFEQMTTELMKRKLSLNNENSSKEPMSEEICSSKRFSMTTTGSDGDSFSNSFSSFQSDSTDEYTPKYEKLMMWSSESDKHFGSEKIRKSEKLLAETIFKAIKMRQKYMTASRQPFHRTTNRYLQTFDDANEISFNSIPSCSNDGLNDQIRTHTTSHSTTSQATMDVDALMAATVFEYKDGVMEVNCNAGNLSIKCPITYRQFIDDYRWLREFTHDGPSKTMCYQRLEFLHQIFRFHQNINEYLESAEQKTGSHRDFYKVVKVDNHIHAASAMTQKQLLKLMKRSLKKHPDEKVFRNENSGEILSLAEIFKQINLTALHMNVDMLDVHYDRSTFHRFDRFNSKYNPMGERKLREVFLKTENFNKGRFFALILKEVIGDLGRSKYQYVELRLSIHGHKYEEWDQLAGWALSNQMFSSQVHWMIQFPRTYDTMKLKYNIKSFQEMVHNIFTPLFEVTRDPASHPDLHTFLCHISGFDSVNDESQAEFGSMDYSTPNPPDWIDSTNPFYDYYLYYMYANMCVLNELRSLRKMNTFTFRPHCGEAGSIHHLICGFLFAHNISHGLLLRKCPVMQYLYYLCQIGIAMSPISNHALFVHYNRNPFHEYFCRGLNVTLSTDDPLQFHFGKDPLIEEYLFAAQFWKLTSTDMCELARNSVLMSGFSDKVKSKWLGNLFQEEGVKGNDIKKSNVSNIRIAFRFDTLTSEIDYLLNMTLDA